MRHALKVRRPRLLEAGRVSFLALSLMFFSVLFATTPAFAAYSPLYPHYFPEQGSTESSFIPYKKLAVDGISDSSTFSIYVPAGIKSITFILDVGAGSNHVLVGRFGSEPTKTHSSAANLTVSEPKAKLTDFMDGDFVAKLGSDRSTIIEDSSASLSTGGWIYFKLYKYDGTSLSPRAYSSYYVVDPAQYSPPEGYVPPPPPSDDGGTDTAPPISLPYTTEASAASPSASYTYGPFDLTSHGGKSISIEHGEYSIDGTSSYTNNPGTIPTDAAKLWVRATASSNYSTVSTTRVLIGDTEMVRITLKTMAAPSSGGDSDGTSSPNPFAGIVLEPRPSILDPPDAGSQPVDNPPDPTNDGTENPDTPPVRLRASENDLVTPELVPCTQVDRTNFLQPVIEVNPELLHFGTEDEVAHADAYAIFTVDESAYMVVSDILGNLAVFPFNELAFGPYGTTAINLADGTCECNAFKTVQNFLVAENIGPEELAQWEEDGIEVVFYFGIVPNGDWRYYQGTAFQIVK